MGLKSAPEGVKRVFNELKLTLSRPITLHKISGNYYVYEYSSARDQKKRKTIVKTVYLGGISEDGKFTPKKEGGQERKQEVGTVRPAQTSSKVDKREAIAIRNLSMNGRMSMAKLAKRLGMSTTGARHFVRRLEEKYNIRYFAEVDTLNLGYLRYVALVKFEKMIPSLQEMKEAFENDSKVAFVAMTKGIYDMMVIFYVEGNTSLADFVYEWRGSKALPDYTARWYITPLSMASGTTLPLRKQFAEEITNKKLANVRENGTKSVILTEVERCVLRELIIDGGQSFEVIDKKYGLGLGRSNYAFYKLREKEVIGRITITLTPPNLKYNSAFIIQTNNYKKFTKSRDEWYKDIIGFDNPLVNKDAFRGDMGIPDSILQIRPIFDEASFNKTAEKLASIEGTEIESVIITNIVIGSLCYRNFDPTYTKVYERLLNGNRIPVKNRIDYE